jgi:hypothetical protein
MASQLNVYSTATELPRMREFSIVMWGPDAFELALESPHLRYVPFIHSSKYTIPPEFTPL